MKRFNVELIRNIVIADMTLTSNIKLEVIAEEADEAAWQAEESLGMGWKTRQVTG